MKRYILPLLLCASYAHADVYVLDSDTIKSASKAKVANAAGLRTSPTHAKPGEKAKRGVPIGTVSIQATGSQGLIDASGVKYFINTNITFSTSSSASAAMSEASYTHAVAATTLNGATVDSTLNDAFDGYNTLCVSLNGTLGTCETGNANFVIYNKNGAATTECNGRQVSFPVQTVGPINVQRKVYVPDADSFARWQNILTNTSGATQTFAIDIANNLGSDSNTTITGSSSGSLTPTAADRWIATFQNYSGTTSSDPRLGHVLQGSGAGTPVAALNFANGDDNPWWGYTVTLAPGQTKIIMNYVAVQPSKAAAASKAAALSQLTPASSLTCMSAAQVAQVANFVTRQPTLVSAPSLDAKLLALLGLFLSGLAVLRLRAVRSR